MAGLWGRCPRCGKGKLFAGFLALAPRCEHCGLDFSFADSADGPAFFVMFISGFIVAGSALAVEITYAPPYWVHAVLWGPLILLVTLLPLRALKGFQRIHLRGGEKKTVELTLHDRELSIVDESGKHRVVPGQVDVWIGGGQPVSRAGLTPTAGLKTQFAIAAGAVLPD